MWPRPIPVERRDRLGVERNPAVGPDEVEIVPCPQKQGLADDAVFHRLVQIASRNAVDDESHTVRGRYGRRIRLQSPRGLNGALACSEEDHDLVVDAVDLNANGIERGRKCTYLYTYVHACI